MAQTKSLPLEGITVIDAASFIAAPVVSAVMSDYGAEVIKLESLTGDTYRKVYKNSDLWPEGLDNWQFLLENRNKKSLALNLKTNFGHEILGKLVEKADVFITNLPNTSRKKLKVTDNIIRNINPRIIYASLSGYGESGPDAGRTALDAAAFWARSGMMEWTKSGSLENLPAFPIPGVGDHPTGIALLSSILLALINRGKTGLGTTVSTSLFANGIWANAVLIQSMLAGNQPIETFWWEELSALRNLYKTKDGSLLFLMITDEKKHWPVFLKALKIEFLAEDKRFNTDKNRNENKTILKSTLQEAFRKLTFREIRDKLIPTGIVFSQVATAKEILDDPQLNANDMLIGIDNDNNEKVRVVAPPLNIENAPRRNTKIAPKLGQHNIEILSQLGYSKREIKLFKTKNIIS